MSVQTNVNVIFSTARKLSVEKLHEVEKASNVFEGKSVESTLAIAMTSLIYKFCNLSYDYDIHKIKPIAFKEYSEVLPYKDLVDYVPTTYDTAKIEAWRKIFEVFNYITGNVRVPHFITKKFINDEKSDAKKRP